jgi:hypothetical protein
MRERLCFLESWLLIIWLNRDFSFICSKLEYEAVRGKPVLQIIPLLGKALFSLENSQ